MAVVRPRTIGPAPVRAETKWQAAGDSFFASRCKAEGGGKKLATDVAGIRSRRRASSPVFGQTKPIEDALGSRRAQTDRGTCDMAAAIGETLSPPRTDRQFALDQTKTRTSTPVEVLNVSVFDNPEGVPDPPPFARRPTVFSAVRPQRGLREGRSSKRFATTRRSRPRSTPCGRGREPEPRDRFICIRQIRAE